jgi:GNAT superfamily N-acetyltransferase
MMGPGSTRPMAAEDVHRAAALFVDSIAAVQAAYALPGPTTPEEVAARTARLSARMTHMLATDPGGSWVAQRDGDVVGVAQAIVRDGLWVLSVLGVAGGHQDQGVGRALLERALGYGPAGCPGLIYSSRDPRAIRRYVRSGFALLPAIEANGRVRRESVAPVPEVRPGGAADRALVDSVDRHLRGASHGPDLDYLLERGAQLLVVDDRGYAVVLLGSVLLLGALDDAAARLLLRAAVAELSAPDTDAEVRVEWLTADQQWAFEVCTGLGLELHPVGAVMVRGRPGPLTPYVPSGGFG